MMRKYLISFRKNGEVIRLCMYDMCGATLEGHFSCPSREKWGQIDGCIAGIESTRGLEHELNADACQSAQGVGRYGALNKGGNISDGRSLL